MLSATVNQRNDCGTDDSNMTRILEPMTYGICNHGGKVLIYYNANMDFNNPTYL